MGFVVFMVMGLYVLISFGVVALAVSYATKRGKSSIRWGLSAALVMYLIPCWDWIPTVVAHKYYCEKEAGFWVYKTLDQWKAENPGVMEGLVDNSPNEYPNWPSENWNGREIASINQRFGMLYTNHLHGLESELFLNNWRWETELVDKKTGGVLARRVDFSMGNEGYIGGMHSLKFWLISENCMTGKEHSRKFGEFLKQLRGAKK
jgi:hypothetical protein